jgi:hypothetical protein
MIDMDVRRVLPTISAPTLVLHKRDDAAVPVAEGRRPERSFFGGHDLRTRRIRDGVNVPSIWPTQRE